MAGTRQHQATGGGDEQQQVELFPVVRVALEPGATEGTGGQGADEHQPHVEDRVAVHLQQGSDPLIPLGHHDGQGEERQVEACDGHHEGGVIAAFPGDGEHQGHHGPRGQQQGQQGQ